MEYIHQLYNLVFEEYLRYMNRNELEDLIREMGMRIFTDSDLNDKDSRANLLWTEGGNLISSYDIYPNDLSFNSYEEAIDFINALNDILQDHSGFITLAEIYKQYNLFLEKEDLKFPFDGANCKKIVTNPVDTILGYLLERFDEKEMIEGVTGASHKKVIFQDFPEGRFHIDFDSPVDVSRQKVTYFHQQSELEKEKKRRKKK